MVGQSKVGAWIKSAWVPTNSCMLQLFGCPSTWSARAHAFYEFKTQFTAGWAVHVGLLSSRVLKGL